MNADIAVVGGGMVGIAVVGGGMVGAALACGLAQQGFQVALLELSEPVEDWPQDSYDLRVSAITRASQHIFEHLHAWQGMLDRRATPYQRMQVWDATGNGWSGCSLSVRQGLRRSSRMRIVTTS